MNQIKEKSSKEQMTASELRKKWKTTKKMDNVILFYGSNARYNYACFSNFFPHNPFKYTISLGLMKGTVVQIPFSEMAIMLEKASLMGNKQSFEKIINLNQDNHQMKGIKKQKKVKALGRQVTPWDQNKWDKNVCLIAKTVVTQKFKKVPGLKQILLKTGDSIIAEAAPRDKNWGIGMGMSNLNAKTPSKWKGANILGWALMEARRELSHT